jgi:NAD+ synthase
VKVTSRNFGRDRRYPITNRFRDSAGPLPAPDETLVSRGGRASIDAFEG